ncbi:MAG TPA: hypothetical protein VIG90_02710 [Pedomonas sp.]
MPVTILATDGLQRKQLSSRRRTGSLAGEDQTASLDGRHGIVFGS